MALFCLAVPIEKSHGQNVGDGMGRISVQGSVSSTTFTPTTAHGVGDYSREITAIRFIVTFPPTIAAMVTDNFTRSGTTWTNTSTNGSAVYTITCTGCRETDDITVDVATVQNVRITSHNVTIRNLTNANVLNGPSRGMVVISSASLASVDNNRALMFDLNPAATAPTLTSLTAMATGRMITWTATFSEPVDGVAMGNFNLSGTRMAQTTATAPMAMSPTNGLSNIWTFTSTTTGNEAGTVIYTFDADPAINNEADVALTEVPTDGSQTATITLMEVDATAPTTTISSSVSGNTITWTVTFSEMVTNIAARHFNLSAGTLGTVPSQSSGSENTITITSTHTATTDGTITLSFDGDRGTGDNAADAAGNIAGDATDSETITIADPNTGGGTGGGTPTTPAPMQQANALVAEFMQQNAVQYIAALPNLSNRLIRKGGDNIGQKFTTSGAINGTNERLYLQGTLAASGTEFWIDGTYIDGEGTSAGNTRTSESYYLNFGADFAYNENLILGLMAQIDESTFKQNTAELNTEGWLFGGYLIGQLKSSLRLETKLATGESTFKAMNREIESERLLFSSAIFRNLDFDGTGALFTPRLEYVYFVEETPTNEIELNSTEMSLTASSPIKYGDAILTPTLTFAGSIDNTDNYETATAKVKIGIGYEAGKINWNLSGHYDVLTEDTHLETYGITGGVNIKF